MEGIALAAMLPHWSYKSELLTPKPKAYHHFLQKVTILPKAINRNKPFCLACGSLACSWIPSRGKVFIYVYRLAIDVRTRKGDDVAD